MRYVMVLNDGETFSDLDGCTIAEVPDYFDKDSVKGWGYPVIAEFSQVDDVVMLAKRWPPRKFTTWVIGLRKGT